MYFVCYTRLVNRKLRLSFTYYSCSEKPPVLPKCSSRLALVLKSCDVRLGSSGQQLRPRRQVNSSGAHMILVLFGDRMCAVCWFRPFGRLSLVRSCCACHCCLDKLRLSSRSCRSAVRCAVLKSCDFPSGAAEAHAQQVLVLRSSAVVVLTPVAEAKGTGRQNCQAYSANSCSLQTAAPDWCVQSTFVSHRGKRAAFAWGLEAWQGYCGGVASREPLNRQRLEVARLGAEHSRRPDQLTMLNTPNSSLGDNICNCLYLFRLNQT